MSLTTKSVSTLQREMQDYASRISINEQRIEVLKEMIKDYERQNERLADKIGDRHHELELRGYQTSFFESYKQAS